MPTKMTEPLSGLRLIPGFLDPQSQAAVWRALRTVLTTAPLYVPRMPKSGKPLSVRMTNCGPLGWVSDECGYRYQRSHPETGHPWPPLPPLLLDAWRSLARYPHPPESCLVNYYGPSAKMGLHQDRDECDFIVLGGDARLAFHGVDRIMPGTSTLLPQGGRINLTLRHVTRPS